MSRTDHHSNEPRKWTERVRGVRYVVVKPHHRSSAREAIREQLADTTPTVIRLGSRVPELYDGLQADVSTYTIQTRGYALPVPPRMADRKVDTDARPNQRVRVQHVIPTKRRPYDDSLRDCWREQTSRSSRSLVDGPMR